MLQIQSMQHTYFCSVSICPDKISLNVSISNTFSRKLRVARLKLPLLAVDNVFDCNEMELSCRPSDASFRPLKLLNTALAYTIVKTKNKPDLIIHTIIRLIKIAQTLTYIVRLQYIHPIALVFGRLAAQIPNTIVNRHIESAFVKLVALHMCTKEKKQNKFVQLVHTYWI